MQTAPSTLSTYQQAAVTISLRVYLSTTYLQALSQALLQHPGLNASLAPDGSELLMHGSHNIGVSDRPEAVVCQQQAWCKP
jgi:hypothetical protein